MKKPMSGAMRFAIPPSGLRRAELMAADQDFAHSRMMAKWGFHRLYERIAHEHEEELEHADKLIRRILFLEEADEAIDWLENQHGLLASMGLPNDLQSAMGELSEG
jgi:bacterioferritin (cytochrome b1)